MPWLRVPGRGSRRSGARPAGRRASDTMCLFGSDAAETSAVRRSRRRDGSRPLPAEKTIVPFEPHAPPRAAAASQRVRGPSGRFDPLELRLREESERAAVRRPERKRGAFGPVERPRLERVELPDKRRSRPSGSSRRRRAGGRPGRAPAFPANVTPAGGDREADRRRRRGGRVPGSTQQGGPAAAARREGEPPADAGAALAAAGPLRNAVGGRRERSSANARSRADWNRSRALLEAVPHDAVERGRDRSAGPAAPAALRAGSPSGSRPGALGTRAARSASRRGPRRRRRCRSARRRPAPHLLGRHVADRAQHGAAWSRRWP